MNYTDIYTRSSDKTLHSIACGNGSIPFHFLHANGFCAGTYLPFFELFESDFNIIATDIPGHGDSDHHGADRIHHWNLFVNDIRNVIANTFQTPVTGAGHSLGAVTTLLLAAEYPHLFSRIILIDPVILPPSVLFFAMLAKRTGLIRHLPLSKGARRRKHLFSDKNEAYTRFSSGRGMFKNWPEPFIRAYCDHGLRLSANGSAVLKCDPETEAQIYESILNDVWNYPIRINCPVLVIRGEQSDTFLPSAAAKLQNRLRECTLETVPKTGHFVVMENAEACSRIIKKFIFNNA